VANIKEKESLEHLQVVWLTCKNRSESSFIGSWK